MRWLLALFYGVAGYVHIANPAPFLQIMPGAVPFPEAVVFWTGIAELAGAAGLLQPFSPKLRRAAGIGLALYALCVWPANMNHFVLDMARADGGLGLAYHIPRMIAQPVIIWLALWVGGTTDWPFRHRT
nr:DoxX family protein [Parerythrobacter lacustris]